MIFQLPKYAVNKLKGNNKPSVATKKENSYFSKPQCWKTIFEICRPKKLHISIKITSYNIYTYITIDKKLVKLHWIIVPYFFFLYSGKQKLHLHTQIKRKKY